MSENRQYLTASELAWELRRSVWYVYGMKKAGFIMPGGTATVEEAKEWLRSHPNFSARKAKMGEYPKRNSIRHL